MKIVYLITLVLFCSIQVLRGDIAYNFSTNELVTVTSYTDGNGLFTYTFSGGTNELYRFRNPTINIEASFITSIESPVGWDPTLESGAITWEWTGGEPLIVDNTPFTFTVHCSQTESTINNLGIIGGDIYTELPPEPGSSNIVGINKFSYLQPIPEPTTLSFMAIAGGIYLFRRRIRK